MNEERNVEQSFDFQTKQVDDDDDDNDDVDFLSNFNSLICC